jgi:hypothetical protein
MHQRKLAAKPQPKYTPSKHFTKFRDDKRSTPCPKCGDPKAPWAKLCLACFRQSSKSPIDNKTYTRDGRRYRRLSLSQGLYTLVDAEEYDFLSQFPCHTHFSESNKPYACAATAEYKRVRLHKIILNLKYRQTADHINGDTLDNRRSNLRICTSKQNRWNRKKNRNNTSGYRGVYWHKRNKKWTTIICIEGVNKRLGQYNTAIEAAIAYDDAAIKHRDEEFRRLNFTNDERENLRQQVSQRPVRKVDYRADPRFV